MMIADSQILQRRYIVHVAGYNLGFIMRLLVGQSPRECIWSAL